MVRVKVYLNSYNTQHLLLNPIQAQLHLLRKSESTDCVKDIMGLQGEHTLFIVSKSSKRVLPEASVVHLYMINLSQK